jgi:hypothetical protein
MGTVVGIIALVVFATLLVAAFGKPFMHALGTGPVPRIRPGPFRPPPWGGGDTNDGVREPRRPAPSGAAAVAQLPEPRDPG